MASELVDMDAAHVAAYLHGDCLVCLSVPVTLKLPEDARMMCEECARTAGWAECHYHHTLTLDWHTWDEGVDPICLDCLNVWLAQYPDDMPKPWYPETCDCFRCTQDTGETV